MMVQLCAGIGCCCVVESIGKDVMLDVGMTLTSLLFLAPITAPLCCFSFYVFRIGFRLSIFCCSGYSYLVSSRSRVIPLKESINGHQTDQCIFLAELGTVIQNISFLHLEM